jgi:hypothetical protein
MHTDARIRHIRFHSVSISFTLSGVYSLILLAIPADMLGDFLLAQLC